MADVFLTTVLKSVSSVIYGVIAGLEFLVGISYVCGKTLTEAIITAAFFLWDCSCDTKDGLKYLFQEFVEFEKAIIHGFFLVYYGIGKIIEAFQITIVDLVNFISHMFVTIAQVFENCFNAVVDSVSILALVPDQLCTALTIVGDSVLIGLYYIGVITHHFIRQLFVAPLNVLIFVTEILHSLALAPVKILRGISPTAYFGLGFMFVMYFVYCKLSVVVFIRSFVKLIRWLYIIVGKFHSQLYRYIFRRQSSVSNRKRTRTTSESLTDSPESTKGMCVVCHETAVDYISRPCKHVCLCEVCVRRLVEYDNRCPICRQIVTQFERVYLS